MNQDEIVASVDLIRASLLKRNSVTITGALLGEMIRKITPGLNLRQLYPSGQKVLSRFIKDFCSEFLTPLQKQGGDILYSVTSDFYDSSRPDSSVNVTLSAVNYDYWVTFARPNISSSVFVSAVRPEILIDVTEAPASGWIRVRSVTSSEMIGIRRSFIEGLDPKAFDSSIYSCEGSYSDWLESVRRCGGSLFNKWSAFRIGRLHDLFRVRLEQLGVADDNVELLCQVMKLSQESQPKKISVRKDVNISQSVKPPSFTNPSEQLTSGEFDFLRSEESFRGAVVEAVKRMSLSEMRALNIPAGLFMDSVNIILNK